MSKKIELCDGKYSVINNNGILKTFRYGGSWDSMDYDLIGNSFVLALIHKIEDLQDMLFEENHYESVDSGLKPHECMLCGSVSKIIESKARLNKIYKRRKCNNCGSMWSNVEIRKHDHDALLIMQEQLKKDKTK